MRTDGEGALSFPSYDPSDRHYFDDRVAGAVRVRAVGDVHRRGAAPVRRDGGRGSGGGAAGGVIAGVGGGGAGGGWGRETRWGAGGARLRAVCRSWGGGS